MLSICLLIAILQNQLRLQDRQRRGSHQKQDIPSCLSLRLAVMRFFAGSLRDARVVVVALTEAVLLRTPPYSSGRTTPVDSNHLFTGSRQVRAV